MSDPYRHMSNQDLESHGREWADLPMFPAESIPNPEGYPDEFDNALAELQELAGRVFIVLGSKLADRASSFTLSFSSMPDDWIGQKAGIASGASRPGFRLFPPDRAAEMLAAWREQLETAA